MEHKTKRSSVWAEIEPYCLLRIIWKNLWMVLLSAGLFALLAYIATSLMMKPSYTCSTTFVVTPKYSSTAGSTGVTTNTAEQFASLLSSSMLRKRVVKDYGALVDGVTVSTSVVKNTSMINLSVTGRSPSSVYYMATGINEHYEEFSPFLFDSMILESVTAPNIPGNSQFRARQERLILVAAVLGALAMAVLLAVVNILSGTLQTNTGVRRQVDGNLLVTLNHERKHRTLKGYLTRRKTSLLISNPTTAFLYTESIHQLRAKVEHERKHHGSKTFLVTSVVENEGKSTVAANLALSLAKRYKKVLLVDCDLRKSAQYLIFGAKPEKNNTLNALLKGELEPSALVDALQYRKADNLFCLFSYGMRQRSADVLGSAQMRQLMKILRSSFDYVIVDSSPMGYFTDSEVLADLTDASMLVLRQDMVTDLAANDAIDALSRGKARFMGYVFNDVHTLNLFARLMGSKRGYGYGYGYGYGGYGYGYGKRGYGKHYGYGYGYNSDKTKVDSDGEEVQKED